MSSAQLLLRYQALVDRERALRDFIEAVESRLGSDPEVVRREEALENARERQKEFAGRLSESDKKREDHRTALRTREKQLMSGRINNPTELMQMSDEVAHMKARFKEEARDARGLFPPRSDSGREAPHPGMRGVSEDGRHLGAPAVVRGLRPRRVL